jgi:lysyl-tRNA synthetase class I
MNNIEKIVKEANDFIRTKITEAQTLEELDSLHLSLINQIKQNCSRMCVNGFMKKEADDVEEKLCTIMSERVNNKRNWILDEMRSNFKFEFNF